MTDEQRKFIYTFMTYGLIVIVTILVGWYVYRRNYIECRNAGFSKFYCLTSQ